MRNRPIKNTAIQLSESYADNMGGGFYLITQRDDGGKVISVGVNVADLELVLAYDRGGDVPLGAELRG